MRNTRAIVWLGVFAVVCLMATVVVVASLLDVQTGATRSYKAIFTDASGLETGDPVRIAGIKVGRVTSVNLDGTRAEVDFQVASNQLVDGRTTAAIHYESLLGQRNVELLRPASTPSGPGCGPRCIPLSRTAPALDLTDLFNGFQPLFAALTPQDINTLTGNIIGAFQGEGSNFAGLIDETANLTSNLADRDQVIDEVIDNLTQTMQLLGGHDQQLGSLIDSFARVTGDLAGERQDISSAISSTSGLVQSFNGLVTAVQQPLQTDIAGLNSAFQAVINNKGALSTFLAQIPKTLTNVNRMFENGGFAKAYICNAKLNTSGPLVFTPDVIESTYNLSPGVLPIINNVMTVNLPQGYYGDPNIHTPNCKP